jgi:PAS domain S-box-containing protein
MASTPKPTAEEIIEGLADAVGLTTLDGKFLYVNAEFERSTGWSREEAIGRTALELGVVSEADFEAIGRDVVPKLHREGFARNLEGTAYTREGRGVPVAMSWALLRDQEGEPVALLQLVRDISAKKRAEDALHASEERWRSLVEHSPDIIINADLDGKSRTSRAKTWSAPTCSTTWRSRRNKSWRTRWHAWSRPGRP